jgi:RNA polymerase sigma factor (sigma-70 family)
MLHSGQSSSDAPSPRGLFPTTRWTIVSHLGNGERRLRFVAWDEFFRSYQRPLYLWLLARMGNPHEAEELVQSFLTRLHAKHHALDALDASKGQLRSWLLTCLRRHWIDEWRKRGPASEEIPHETENSSPFPDDIYDREWAFSLSRRVLDGMKIEYQARGKNELFDELLKALDSPEESNRSLICKRLEISENHFAVAHMRFRERLAVRLREEVAATVIGDDAAEIDAELRHLIGILSRQGGLTAATRA